MLVIRSAGTEERLRISDAAGEPNTFSENGYREATMPKAKKGRVVAPASKEVARYKNHAYLNPDGTVNGEKLLSIVNDAPGVFDLIMLNAIVKDGHAAGEYHFMASEIVSRLVLLVLLAGNGDERSATQLKAIKKLSKPEKYELSPNKIRDIVERYETSPPLARGWELRRLMSALSNVVEPVKKDTPYSQGQPIKLKESPRAVFVGLWDLARKHLKPNSTLQSLAIRIYLESLQEKGITDEGEAITSESLKRDLRRAREWERATNEDEKLRRGRHHGLSLSDDPITWYDFSEGWKERRVKRRESTKGGKSRHKLT
jgi:hypothetical protein